MDSNKQPHPRRRATDIDPPADPIAALEARMTARMSVFESKLDKNTELTQTVVSLFGTMEAGMKFLGWMGAALKWAVTIAGAIGALWAMMPGQHK